MWRVFCRIFGASLISLFYGEGDYKETKDSYLCGWDSDNPASKLGFMYGKKKIVELLKVKCQTHTITELELISKIGMEKANKSASNKKLLMTEYEKQ